MMKQWFLHQKPLLKALGIVALCAFSFLAGFWLHDLKNSPEEKLIDAAYQQLATNSIFNQQTRQGLAYTAIRGMIASLNDPYAELIEPQAAANFNDTFAGQTGVVGLYAENKAGQTVISIVFPGGSAAQAGLRPGDIIQSIGDISLDSSTDSSEAGLMLRGKPGTTVHLKTLRGGQPLEYDLVRQVRAYVDSKMLPGGVGYVSLTAFNQTAADQMKQALEGLMAQKPAGLVWDLRNNEGGDMLAAQQILSYFVKDGLLFTAELTGGRTVQFLAKGNPIVGDMPLVVLMDKTTYSAAETCAAAIEETGRGTTVGSHSYGKGLIQATIPLRDDTLLQMTIARWRSPKGQWYQGNGVPAQVDAADDPDTETDEMLQKGLEILANR